MKRIALLILSIVATLSALGQWQSFTEPTWFPNAPAYSSGYGGGGRGVYFTIQSGDTVRARRYPVLGQSSSGTNLVSASRSYEWHTQAGYLLIRPAGQFVQATQIELWPYGLNTWDGFTWAFPGGNGQAVVTVAGYPWVLEGLQTVFIPVAGHWHGTLTFEGETRGGEVAILVPRRVSL